MALASRNWLIRFGVTFTLLWSCCWAAPRLLANIPQFKPVTTGQASGFDLGVARRPGAFALRFEGYLRLDHDGEYRFHLTSDDGSKLFLDGKQVAANDGIHPPSTTSSAARLTKGTHKLTAGVFNAGGGVELHVDIEGPGLGRQDVAPLLTLKPEGNLKPTVKPADPKEDDDFPIQPELAAKGRELFASLGCANCHQMNIDKKQLLSILNPSL